METRNPALLDEEQGLYRKYEVKRLGDAKGKHANCNYYVLDLMHDKFSAPALRAYADACESEFPELAKDLRNLVGESGEGEQVVSQCQHNFQYLHGASTHKTCILCDLSDVYVSTAWINRRVAPAPASPDLLEPGFPIGKCKHCGKDVPDAKRNGRTILFCSYKCYCEG